MSERYEVHLTETSLESYLAIPDARLEKGDAALDALAVFPGIGVAYDPLYPAARPPFEVSVLYADRYGIYYSTDERAKVVYIRYVEDERMDPRLRFTGRLH